MASVRPPAVAGTFYPGDARELRTAVQGFLAEATASGPAPKAMIAPHAGYIYSGAVAATVYARLRDARTEIEQVVLLGPAHREPVRGLAAPSANAFATPLGEVQVDRDALEQVLALAQVQVQDSAHRLEHSLEVHLPFLQEVIERFTLVPLVAGEATGEEVAEVLETLWDGPRTLIVISSDLSHYHDYETARRLDSETSRAIEALAPEDIGYEQACGRVPINGLLTIAAKLGLKAETLDLRNSGDTAGSRAQVVGYGAYVFG